MALKSQASRRYALALVESVGEAKDTSLDRALQELGAFAKLVEVNFDLRNALLNPVFTASERAKVLKVVLDAGAFSVTIRRFIELLVEKDRVRELGEIAEAFHLLADERRGRLRADVKSASPLSPESMDRLRRTLERTTGKSIELHLTVDPSLIGGIRASVGSLVFDGTIRADLDRLRSTLLQAD